MNIQNELPDLKANIQTETDLQFHKFREAVMRCATVGLQTEVDVTHLDPAEAAAQIFYESEYHPGSTFYIAPQFAEFMQGHTIVGMEALESRAARMSRHKVFFLNLKFEEGSELAVAIKPHELEPSSLDPKKEAQASCLKDYFTNVAAQQIGLETLNPVGFIIDSQGVPYSITQLYKGLSTLDSTYWANYYKPGEEISGMNELLDKSAEAVADVHHLGASYLGDLAFRNIATNLYGRVFLIDWEYGKVTLHDAESDEQNLQRTVDELGALMYDLAAPPDLKKGAGVGLFTHNTGSWWEGFQSIFLNKYFERRLKLANGAENDWEATYQFEEDRASIEEQLERKMASLEDKYHTTKSRG